MWSGEIATIAPSSLERAATLQRIEYPNDDIVLDRLFSYLERARPLLAEIAAAVCELYLIEPSDLRNRRHRSEAEVAMARQRTAADRDPNTCAPDLR